MVLKRIASKELAKAVVDAPLTVCSPLGTVQSAATAAGGLTTLFVAAVPAMYHLGLMTTPQQDMGKLFLLTAISAFYGLFFAVPLRKYYIRKRIVYSAFCSETNGGSKWLSTTKTRIPDAHRNSVHHSIPPRYFYPLSASHSLQKDKYHWR